MLNSKWLKVSMFIPVFGTIINCFMLYIESFKQKNFSRKRLGLCMAVCAVMFLVGMIVCALLFKFICFISNSSIDSQIQLIFSFVISGLLMNIIFKKYYRETFVSNS